MKKWEWRRTPGQGQGKGQCRGRAAAAMLVTLFGLGLPGWASAQVSARVYVANRQAATVSVIDGATLAVITTIALPAGSGLQTAAFSANESELLVAGESAGKIFRIDVDTNTLKPAPHEIGPASGHFALDGNGLFIGRPNGTLLETDLFDTTIEVHSYVLPAVVNEIAITINAINVYVSHPGLTSLSRVELDQLVAPVDLGFVPSQILIDRGTLFAAGGAAHVVRMIDPLTAATIDTIDVVREATRLAVSPDGKKLYVSHGPDEGSQGFFSTFILLLNPDDGSKVFGGLPPVANITFFREGAAPVVKQFPMPFLSRITIDVSTIPELANTSFGARVDCFPTCVAERVMYFGQPLFSGGTAAAGATAPSRDWFLAEGATGSYFNTYVLLANPDQEHDAHVTLTYLPESGQAVTRQVTLAAGRRMTRDIASEDLTLVSAAVSTRVESDIPLVVERAQYWPTPTWYEGHASLGMTETRRHWGLAEGRVGGPNADQTYILLANPGDTPASVTLTFLRDAGSGSGGTPLEKTFTVPPTSRFNVAINGPGSSVPELAGESFGVDIVSTQPIAVERSMYSNANGVIWAAGTNAAASRLP